ncbi:MAG: hypothetical protein C0418_05655 [Coriobacteriaceae bacterium]|nr:hypothetical protein [Coriobacteriaceae bacterium]
METGAIRKLETMSTEDPEQFEEPAAEPDEAAVAEVDYDDAEDTDAAFEEAPPDPVQRWLLGIAGLIIVVFVAAAVSLVLYVLSMRDAPRTSVERAINSDEVAAREDPQDVENWARLALSYATAERWPDALAAIERGRRLRKAAILDLTEADILRMKGDEAAIAAYARAIKSAQAEYDAQVKQLREKKGIVTTTSNVLVFEAMYGRARALDSFGRTDEAIVQARQALQLDPTAADVHVFLGDLLAKEGQDDEAEAEFKAALTYVPDLALALEGLRKLEEGK